MTPDAIAGQLREIYARLIASSLSVQQNGVSDRVISLTQNKQNFPVRTIGDLPTTTALKDIPYSDLYADMLNKNAYHIKMIDGALISFQYTFRQADSELIKHRLALFPSHLLPTIEEAPELYSADNLYSDILENRLVRFPIRFDYDPVNYVDSTHPKSHVTLGQFSACRIPVAGPVLPYAFVLFIVRNFYASAYLRYRNSFDKRFPYIPTNFTISDGERRMTHFVMGRNYNREYEIPN